MKKNTFWGKVQHGQKRGRALGFPTANVALHREIPEGIYISQTTLQSITGSTSTTGTTSQNKLLSINSRDTRATRGTHTTLFSLTFVGAAKTFGQTNVISETYILDFDEMIYDRWITITLIKKIRDNKKFSGVEDLVKQMKEDEKKAREYFESKKIR
jgi:riboflavin kinase / FMN adenylyltransferase